MPLLERFRMNRMGVAREEPDLHHSVSGKVSMQKSIVARTDLRTINSSQSVTYKTYRDDASLLSSKDCQVTGIGARLFGVTHHTSSFAKAEFDGSFRINTEHKNVLLRESIVNAAPIGQANIDRAWLQKVHLGQANLFSAAMSNTRLEVAVRTGANLSPHQFMGACGISKDPCVGKTYLSETMSVMGNGAGAGRRLTGAVLRTASEEVTVGNVRVETAIDAALALKPGPTSMAVMEALGVLLTRPAGTGEAHQFQSSAIFADTMSYPFLSEQPADNSGNRGGMLALDFRGDCRNWYRLQVKPLMSKLSAARCCVDFSNVRIRVPCIPVVKENGS